jgi:hypothetical protein
MTHDELLERVNEYISSECDCESCNFINGPYKALLAVVKLHKPDHSIRGYRCTFDDELFPCLNIQAIEKELK